jgi:hypothetical protein
VWWKILEVFEFTDFSIAGKAEEAVKNIGRLLDSGISAFQPKLHQPGAQQQESQQPAVRPIFEWNNGSAISEEPTMPMPGLTPEFMQFGDQPPTHKKHKLGTQSNTNMSSTPTSFVMAIMENESVAVP